MALKLGYKPSPSHKVGLGPLRDLTLTAGSLPTDAFVQLPSALDQLFQDCVANSGFISVLHGEAVVLGTPNGPWPELGSRAFAYAMLRLRSGGALNVDDGGYIHAFVESIIDVGFPRESAWTYGPEHLDVWPEWRAFRAAADQKLVKGARRIISTGDRRVQDVMTAIAGGAVVQWGTVLDRAFPNLGRDDVWPGVRGVEVGGHAMVLHAYRTINGRVHFASRSSWTATFADDGSAWVDEEAIASADAEDFWIWETAPLDSGTT